MNKRIYGATKKQQENLATKIIEQYKQSPEYEKDKAIWEREFVDYVIYGKPLHFLNEQVVNEIIAFSNENVPYFTTTVYKISPEEILKKFGSALTEEEIQKLKEYGRSDSRNGRR